MNIQVIKDTGEMIALIPVNPNLANVTRDKALYYCGCAEAMVQKEGPCTRGYIAPMLRYIATLVGDVREMRLIGPPSQHVGGFVLSED